MGEHKSKEKNLFIAIIINIFITILEIIGGIISGSLALLSDAFHNFSDVVSLIISYFAILIGQKEKNFKKTFGYKRAEIIAAFFNVILLIIACFFIITEAVKRFKNPEIINTHVLLIIAIIGFAGNGISIFILFKDSEKNLNIKSAFLHLLGDTISSLIVIVVSLIMLFKPYFWLDSVFSILIALYIIKESFSILIKTINILMQSTPREINLTKIKKRLLFEKKLGIQDIHHLHVWELTPGEIIFDLHVVIKKKDLLKADYIINQINTILSKEFKICHSTIQIESEKIRHSPQCQI